MLDQHGIYIHWAIREIICILAYLHILNIEETISDTLVTHPQYLQPWHSLQYAYHIYVLVCVCVHVYENKFQKENW